MAVPARIAIGSPSVSQGGEPRLQTPERGVHYRIIDDHDRSKDESGGHRLDESPASLGRRGWNQGEVDGEEQKGGDHFGSPTGDRVELAPSPRTARQKAAGRLLAKDGKEAPLGKIGVGVTVAVPHHPSGEMAQLLKTSLTRAKMSLEQRRVGIRQTGETRPFVPLR